MAFLLQSLLRRPRESLPTRNLLRHPRQYRAQEGMFQGGSRLPTTNFVAVNHKGVALVRKDASPQVTDPLQLVQEIRYVLSAPLNTPP